MGHAGQLQDVGFVTWIGVLTRYYGCRSGLQPINLFPGVKYSTYMVTGSNSSGLSLFMVMRI